MLNHWKTDNHQKEAKEKCFTSVSMTTSLIHFLNLEMNYRSVISIYSTSISRVNYIFNI